VAEQRKHHRVPIRFEVTCIESDASSFTGTVRDISIGGMFVGSERNLAFGTPLTLVLKGVAARELRLPALVRWSEPQGFGVQFGLLGAYDTHVIVELVKKHTT
jgi:type IV pilus assembly protein PilZ